MTWRAAAVFGLLVDARGEPVSREELERRVWGDVHMDYSVLSQSIKALRRALDPAPDGASYIETVPRVGYRLAVPVIDDTQPATADRKDEETPSALPAEKEPERWTARRSFWWASAACLVLAGGAIALGVENFRTISNRQKADLLVEKGLQLIRRGSTESGSEGAILLREALSVVPDYPPANAGLAEMAARAGESTFDHALGLAERAVRDDPNCSECEAILGYVLGTRMWRWQEAYSHLTRAVQLNANRASHRIYLAEWLLVHGRQEDAVREAEEATRLDPAMPRAWSMLATVHYCQKRYAEAVQDADRAVSLDPHHPSAYQWAYHSYMRTGDDAAAVQFRIKLLGARSNDFWRTVSEYTNRFQPILKSSGRRGIAEAWIDEVGAGRALQVQRYSRALWSMWIGDHARAIQELEAGVVSRPYTMIYVAVDPAFEPLRSDPRFQKVVRSVGLPLPVSQRPVR